MYRILAFFEISDFYRWNYGTIKTYIMLKGAGFNGN